MTGWVQAYKQVHPYGSLLHQVASLTNTAKDYRYNLHVTLTSLH